jgi:CheY-like chemotaxis protein/tetratricopeptide (TPR) repeat protein
VALGRCFLGKDEFMVARDHLHRALLAARRAGNGRYRTEAHLLIGKVDWNEGDLEGARYNWTRAGRLAEGAVEPLLLARARLQEAFILYAEGVVKEALPAYHHAIELIREVGHVKILLKAYSGLSRLLTRSGSWVATESLLEERLQLARQHNLGKAEAVALTDLAELRFLQGNVAAAANVINMALERHGKTIYARTQRILARILRARGQKTEAYEALAAGLAAASRKGALEEQVLIGIESALHRVEDGQLAEARRTLDEAEAITSLDPALNLMGRVLYVRGRIHLDDGQQREANRCFTQSLAIFQNVGDPLRTAMCHVAIAELRAQSGRAASARAHLEEAERSYAKLGAGDMLRDVQAKIASLHLEKVQPQMTQMLTLTAPLSMANVPTIALPETPTAAEPPRPCRVLVAETDEAMVKLLKNGLEVENYLVEHVQSGRDALERAIGGDYDFLIVDALLEHRSGFDVCRDLRKRALDAPVIMLGGRLGIEDKIEALQAGADDFIPKQSLVFEELLAKMEALLR